jgi:ATP-dependent DNA ligase
MLLLRTKRLPEGPNWAYELRLDGYRALVFKSYGVAHLRSRNNKSFDSKYPAIVQALARLPDETVVDGQVVALDELGKPSFNALQNSSATAQLFYYVFDVLVLASRNVMAEPLSARRELLRRQVLPRLTEPVREDPQFDASLTDLISVVRELGLEGLVAKRLDSAYDPGQRFGAWAKMRVNRTQDFVIGGYTIGGRHFDALIFGYWEGDRLLYAARNAQQVHSGRARAVAPAVPGP